MRRVKGLTTKSSILIERAEVYEGVARALRTALAKRVMPRSERQQRNADRLLAKALEAENQAARLRRVARWQKER